MWLRFWSAIWYFQSMYSSARPSTTPGGLPGAAVTITYRYSLPPTWCYTDHPSPQRPCADITHYRPLMLSCMIKIKIVHIYLSFCKTCCFSKGNDRLAHRLHLVTLRLTRRPPPFHVSQAMRGPQQLISSDLSYFCLGIKSLVLVPALTRSAPRRPHRGDPCKLSNNFFI